MVLEYGMALIFRKQIDADLQYQMFFFRVWINAANVYISVNTIFECSYLFFG